MIDLLEAISPVDGRYNRFTKELRPIVSEFGLIKYRVHVMVWYLLALGDQSRLGMPRMNANERDSVMSILHRFTLEHAAEIKQLETKGWGKYPKGLNHDVKSCEVWIREQLIALGLADFCEWVHFGCTSEDVNNIAYGLMFRDTLNIVVPSLERLIVFLDDHVKEYAGLGMLSRTHGQAATPTTLGKELAVFSGRLKKQLNLLKPFTMTLKLNGASGNYAAMEAALPVIDWRKFAKEFVSSDIYIKGGEHVAFEQNELTTQIEPHDTYAELFNIFMRINTILIDLSQDLWRYVSDHWIVQQAVEGEVGSSAMPHKVNPIKIENAEGNLGVANALMEYCCRKLPVSRLQRDLSDSTVERVFGTIFGHCLVSYENISDFLRIIKADEATIVAALNAHPEVLTEAYQTILRSVGYPAAYDALKSLSRGQEITITDLHEFVDRLDPHYVDTQTKIRMKSLVVEKYYGLAFELTKAT